MLQKSDVAFVVQLSSSLITISPYLLINSIVCFIHPAVVEEWSDISGSIIINYHILLATDYFPSSFAHCDSPGKSHVSNCLYFCNLLLNCITNKTYCNSKQLRTLSLKPQLLYQNMNTQLLCLNIGMVYLIFILKKFVSFLFSKGFALNWIP